MKWPKWALLKQWDLNKDLTEVRGLVKWISEDRLLEAERTAGVMTEIARRAWKLKQNGQGGDKARLCSGVDIHVKPLAFPLRE